MNSMRSRTALTLSIVAIILLATIGFEALKWMVG